MIDIQKEIIQGDSLEIKVNQSDINIELDDVVNIAIRGNVNLDIIGVLEDSDYVFNITSTQSSNLVEGQYKLILYVTNTNYKKTLYASSLVVKPDLTVIEAGYDFKTHAQKMLEAIEAFIEGRATKNQLDHLMTEVDGKKLQRMSMLELLKLRDYYQGKVNEETGRIPKRFLYSFTR
jgi:hypothetical protein